METFGVFMPILRRSIEFCPGVIAAALVALTAHAIGRVETLALGYELVDDLVFAIVLGTLIHTCAGLPSSLQPGIAFSGKVLLEIAIVLLGATIDARTIANVGPIVIAAVIILVCLSLLVSYGICRLLGLSDRLSTLVACGNSICGNSAIIAAAPVIGARSDDVASSIAFTAALGIVVVLVLPALYPASHFNEWQYGVLAGMTVYAVPQVVAATAPISAVSVQIGTVVKLIRVLMLGPVVLLLRCVRGTRGPNRLPAMHLLPWFIVGFFAAMAARNFGILPPRAIEFASQSSAVLTILSMAALGLSVNMRTVFASGGRVLLAGILSIAALASMSVIGLMVL